MHTSMELLSSSLPLPPTLSLPGSSKQGSELLCTPPAHPPSLYIGMMGGIAWNNGESEGEI